MNIIRKIILRYRIKRLMELCMKIDEAMRTRDWPAWKRKQWWRDFMKSPIAREEFCTGLLKEMERIK
jgi:hypothetical protein